MEIRANYYPTLILKLTDQHDLEINITEPSFPIEVFGPVSGGGSITVKAAKEFGDNFSRAIDNIDDIQQIYDEEIVKAEKAMLRRIKKLL